MSLRKTQIVDKIEILRTGQIQIRLANEVFEDDILIAQSFHRYVLTKGDDVSLQSELVQNICEVVWK